MNRTWPWAVLVLLGAYHGLNPGMGWLFALSLGLQEKSRRAILPALVPIAVGHAVAISLTILAVRMVQAVISPLGLRIVVAAALFGMGLYRVAPSRHPRGGGNEGGIQRPVFLVVSNGDRPRSGTNAGASPACTSAFFHARRGCQL